MTIDQAYINKLQQLLANEDLTRQREHVQQLAMQLQVDPLTTAVALLQLQQPRQTIQSDNLMGIKMLRYRLEVGSNHQVTVEQIKDLLVEESGVDRQNIANIKIHADYTVIDLPDEMPPDIFQHLRTVQINQQPLAIKRVKNRSKKRGNQRRFRHHRQRKASRDAVNANQSAD